MRSTPSRNPDAIAEALALLLEPGSVAELRVLNTNRGTVSGYFDDANALARAAAQWSGQAPGVYVTLNNVLPELLARASNHVVERAKQTTSDRDVDRRRWLLVDLDPVRASGISSTDTEHEGALDRARQIRSWLVELNVPADAIVFADSGNGAHLLLRIDRSQGTRRRRSGCRMTSGSGRRSAPWRSALTFATSSSPPWKPT